MITTWIAIILVAIACGSVFSIIWIIRNWKRGLEQDFRDIFTISFGLPFAFLAFWWFLWIPILDSFDYPSSCSIEQYHAIHPVKYYRGYTGPIKPIREEVIGEKKTCRSLLFGSKRETILKEAIPAKYCEMTTCCDGTCSWSTGRGTCSWHGGVCSH